MLLLIPDVFKCLLSVAGVAVIWSGVSRSAYATLVLDAICVWMKRKGWWCSTPRRPTPSSQLFASVPPRSLYVRTSCLKPNRIYVSLLQSCCFFFPLNHHVCPLKWYKIAQQNLQRSYLDSCLFIFLFLPLSRRRWKWWRSVTLKAWGLQRLSMASLCALFSTSPQVCGSPTLPSMPKQLVWELWKERYSTEHVTAIVHN